MRVPRRSFAPSSVCNRGEAAPGARSAAGASPDPYAYLRLRPPAAARVLPPDDAPCPRALRVLPCDRDGCEARACGAALPERGALLLGAGVLVRTCGRLAAAFWVGRTRIVVLLRAGAPRREGAAGRAVTVEPVALRSGRDRIVGRAVTLLPPRFAGAADREVEGAASLALPAPAVPLPLRLGMVLAAPEDCIRGSRALPLAGRGRVVVPPIRCCWRFC